MGRRITVIGLGLMGGGLARRLASCDFEVHGFDPNETALTAAQSAAVTPHESARHAASISGVVLTSLPTPESLLDTYTISDQGILGHAFKQIFIDVSSVDPGTSLELERRVTDSGSLFIACPLGKGPAQAATGESPLFIGGDMRAVGEVEDVFDTIGQSRYYLGDVQAAATFKLVSNMMAFANLAALCEGYLLACRAGIDPQVFAEAITDTGGMSYQAAVRLPAIIDSDFRPRFRVDLARKDLRLGVDVAARWAIPVPVTAAALQTLALTSAAGYGGNDAAAMILAIAGSKTTEGAAN